MCHIVVAWRVLAQWKPNRWGSTKVCLTRVQRPCLLYISSLLSIRHRSRLHIAQQIFPYLPQCSQIVTAETRFPEEQAGSKDRFRVLAERESTARLDNLVPA